MSERERLLDELEQAESDVLALNDEEHRMFIAELTDTCEYENLLIELNDAENKVQWLNSCLDDIDDV